MPTIIIGLKHFTLLSTVLNLNGKSFSDMVRTGFILIHWPQEALSQDRCTDLKDAQEYQLFFPSLPL